MCSTPDIDSHTALLIVDVQRGFINQHTEHIPDKIEALQTRYDHVIATRFYNAPDSAFRRLLHWDRMAQDSEEFALAFQPTDGAAIIDKDRYSCISEEFLKHLRADDIRTIHIVGIDTNMCVSVCATDIFQTHKFRPVVLSDYCASHSGPSYHEYGLQLLQKAIGKDQIFGP